MIKVGPGYPIPFTGDIDEPWKQKDEQVRYIPLQAKTGDLENFLQKDAIEVLFENEKYFIAPQNSILLLEKR